MLIIALCVLTLLAILGATFVQLMRLERTASNNYVDAQRMDLVTASALDTAMAKLHEASNHYSWTWYNNTNWLFQSKKIFGGRDELAHGLMGVEDTRTGEWENYMEVAGFLFRHKSKIIDTNSQINLNGRQDTLARMLDNLGEAIAASARLARLSPTNPFYTGPRRSGQRVKGEHIMLFRQRLEGQRFQSKNQLRQLIGDQNFELLKDFVTCHSWEDPYTYRASDGDSEVRDLMTGDDTQAQRNRQGGDDNARSKSVHGSPRIESEPRHPINLNTAPKEVLVACLTGIAGRRAFPYAKLGANGGVILPVDQNAQILGERILAEEEVRDVTPRAVWCYLPRLEKNHADQIAERIVNDRKTAKFMRTWRTNERGQPGFEDFIDGLSESFFPTFQQAIFLDPDAPTRRRQLQNEILSAGSRINLLWRRGTAQGTERAALLDLGLPVHQANAWYYEAAKSMIKANFNPNTRLGRYNPNVPAYVPVDKSDLVWAEEVGGGGQPRLKKGHTTEFCFDSLGIFEVTTVGEMLDLSKYRGKVGRSRTTSKKRGSRRSSAYKGPQAPDAAADDFPFRRKVRTIVKVFDVLRHTSQQHFERTFNVGARSSKNDRKFIQTWPEPMNALTELYTEGSPRDGRVELAGLLDAQRQQVNFNSRQQLFGRDPAVVAEHSFSERDSQNISRLRRALQSGGSNLFAGDEVSDSLKGVYDFNYVFQRKTNRQFYRRAQLQKMGVWRDTASQFADPLVARESLETDLLPDGFHTSMFRQAHLNNRLLVLPAHSRIGEAGLGGNPRYGAAGFGARNQNLVGNVPYYNGGIAFWVKFEFNGDDPVFSGLIGCTQVIKEVTTAQDYRSAEGTQFFIFKNTTGQLRIVRMYYHQAFPEGGVGGGGTGGEGIQLFPDPGVSDDDAAAGGDNPILEELDQRKIISRSDIVVDVRHFAAHEWHHIALDWNDQNQAYPIRLYLDFVEVQQGGQPRRAQQHVDGTANSWVRLNQRQPIDGLQVNGLVRPQGVSDAGVFKWYTTTERLPNTGFKTSTPTVKRIIGNATIDELILYQGTFPQVKRHYGTAGGAGYFTNRTGEYANLFEIPLPQEVDHIVLRSFDWTSYYPTTFTDSLPNSPARKLVNEPIRCQLWYPTPTALPPEFDEPWRDTRVTNDVAGRRVYRQQTGMRGRNAEFVYKFSMKGATATTGNAAGGVVQTPVIDDVTLTYYLPSPRILLQEDAD